jgi:phospholipase C
MRRIGYRRAAVAAVSLLAMVSHAMAFGDGWGGPYGHDGYRDGYSDRDDNRSLQEKIELLRRKVKYVFVIFHENESFDHYFGTYPGANGLSPTVCSPPRMASFPRARRRASRSAISTLR